MSNVISTVSFFMDKLPEAEEHLEDLVEYLDTIERTVIKSCRAGEGEEAFEQGASSIDTSSSKLSSDLLVAEVDEDDDAMSEGRRLINEWKTAEAEWKQKVVDIRQHADLVTPYEPKEESGKSVWTAS